jgi:hypothetical protein
MSWWKVLFRQCGLPLQAAWEERCQGFAAACGLIDVFKEMVTIKCKSVEPSDCYDQVETLRLCQLCSGWHPGHDIDGSVSKSHLALCKHLGRVGWSI